MEKRLLLAVVLMTAALFVTNILFPPPPPPAPDAGTTERTVAEAPEIAPPAPVRLPGVTAPASMMADSVVVESDLYRYVFSTRGATLLRAELLHYPSYSVPTGSVQLVPEGVSDFLGHRLVVGNDTVSLDALPYTTSERHLRVLDPGSEVRFEYTDAEGFAVALRYVFTPDDYLIRADGRVQGLAGRSAALITELGPGFEYHEHPDHHSERELAVVAQAGGSISRLPFRRIEGRQVIDSPLAWAGIKDKYFLATVIGGATPLRGAVLQEEAPTQRVVDGREIVLPRVRVRTAIALEPDGSFQFDTYLGPQDYGRLKAIGYDLQEVTPHGYRWLQPIIRPLAAAVLWILTTLHEALGLAYGWVLVIFGVMMRIVLWPLNAKAMRAQMKNMAVQPLLTELREKYKSDPQKQQEAMLALYKEHGFNPFAGCLPLLVPFPVLITLFFVFQNTIAFRGARFLWLPDLSLRDPLYLLPLILVVSMFALQWAMARLSGMEQNPQMKMMMYFMPVMMGVIFYTLPAGLNLYYAVTTLASIPQQVMISQERRRAQEELKRTGGPKLTLPGGDRGKKKPKR